jgi:thioredoxin-related protein
MRSFLGLAVLICAGWMGTSSQLAAATWLTDYDAALKQAKDEGKVVLINFTGSDWCPWCIKLKSEVFDTSQFRIFSEANMVLLEVDFPRRKPQTEEQKAANHRLQEKYPVEGYPTIVLADDAGRALGVKGYLPGGPMPFIAQLKEIPNVNWKQMNVALPAVAPAAPAASAADAAPEEQWGGIKTPPKRYEELKLTGLSGKEGRRFAIINNQTFSAGESAKVKLKDSEVKVLCKEIRVNSVIVQVDGATELKELVFGK